VTAGTGRVVGVDLGGRRIGIAVSDPSRTVATPHSVVQRGIDRAVDQRRIVELAAELGADVIVIGLPRSLSGAIGPAARAVLAEVDAIRALAATHGITVETSDERFSTVVAHQGVRAAQPRRGARRAARTQQVDAAAAAVILQSWLEATR
jgi:putative Holliday junction resolvase